MVNMLKPRPIIQWSPTGKSALGGQTRGLPKIPVFAFGYAAVIRFNFGRHHAVAQQFSHSSTGPATTGRDFRKAPTSLWSSAKADKKEEHL